MLWEPDRGCPDHPQRRREFVAWHGQGSPSHHAALAPGSEVSLFIGNETKTGGSAVVFGHLVYQYWDAPFLAQRRAPGRYIDTGPLCLWHGSSS